MSLLIDTADEIVTVLNAASADETLSQTFTATRKYIPRTDLKDMNSIHVTVVPAMSTPERMTRSNVSLSMIITVAVQQRSTEESTDDDTDTFDPLVTLVEEVDALMLGSTLTVGDADALVSVESSAEREAFMYEHMDKFRQFTSITHYTMLGHY